MSAFRGSEIYINGKTKRRLRWIVTAQGALNANGHPITVDEFAEKLLNEIILERWPMITEHEAKISEAEDKLREQLEAWGDHGHLHT